MKRHPEPRFDDDGELLCMKDECHALARLECPWCGAWFCNDHDGHGHDFACGDYLERREARLQLAREQEQREAAADFARDCQKDEG